MNDELLPPHRSDRLRRADRGGVLRLCAFVFICGKVGYRLATWSGLTWVL
jgi:hypothetical protein